METAVVPRSKHRRKAGGTAVRHPGRRKAAPGRIPISPEWRTWNAFRVRYRNLVGDDVDEATSFLTDLILDEAFDVKGRRVELLATSKADIFSVFTSPLDPEFAEVPEPAFTVEDGEAALAVLLERDLIEVDGDQIRLPSRLAGDEPKSAQTDESVPGMS